MDTSDRLQPAPENTAFDFALLAAKAATLAFPWAGPGVFLFEVITGPLRAKRLTDWCESIRVRLNDLSARVHGLTPGALAANEAFLSAFAEATQAALKTHQPEKIEALRNAVLNIALGYEPMADRQAVFLGFVSRFSSLHLSLLRFFQDPGGYCTVRGKNPPSERDSQTVHLLIFDCLDGIREGIASTVE